MDVIERKDEKEVETLEVIKETEECEESNEGTEEDGNNYSSEVEEYYSASPSSSCSEDDDNHESLSDILLGYSGKAIHSKTHDQRVVLYTELDRVKTEIGIAFSWALSISVLLFAVLYYSFYVFMVVFVLVGIFNSLDYGECMTSLYDKRHVVLSKCESGICLKCFRLLSTVYFVLKKIIGAIRHCFFSCIFYVVTKYREKRQS